MSVEARSVVVRLTAETAQYIANMQAAGRISATAMKPAEAAVMRQSAAIDDLGGKAGKLGLAAGLGIAAMAKAAIDWESQWAGVTKTVDGTSAQLNTLEDDIRGLARTMPATHAEIAATAEAAGQLGVATDDVADFTKVMVEMGETTNLSADGAATSIAQFMNVMQTASGDVDEIGNTIVDLGNKGASTEAQITEMAQRVAGAGATIGATEADVLGLSAAMANLGIESELGGGAVQRVLVGINTQVASGGDKLEQYADVAGTSAEAFAQAWSSDPVRAFDMLVQGLGRIQDQGGDVASVLEQMGIKGTQNLQVMLRLAGSGDMLSRSLDQSAAAWEQNDALTTEYGKRAETTASQIQVAWNQIKDAAIEAGGAILPVVADIASGVGTIAQAYGDLPGPIQDITTAGIALTAVLGGGLWFGAKVVNGVTSTRASLAALRPEITRVGTDLTTRSGVRPFIADLGIMASTSRTAGATTARELARVQAASQRVRSTLGTAALRGGGLLAGIALASSDAAEGIGLTNTASYALMGMIAGPWGAAIGGGIGLIKDFSQQTHDAESAVRDMDDALAAGDMNVFTEALANANDELDRQTSNSVLGTDMLGDSIGGLVNAIAPLSNTAKSFGIISGSAEDLSDGIAKATANAEDLGLAATALGQELGAIGPGAAPSLEQISDILQRAKPAMEDMGITVDDLIAAFRDGSIGEMTADISAWMANADSDAGRIEAVGDAVQGLGNEMETTADRADALSDALDDLLDPQLDLSEATDEWTTALRHLSDDLDKNNRTLKGNSDAAIKNRSAIRDRVEQLKAVLVAEANAGASSGKLSKDLRAQRQALLDAGEAAGISRNEMRDYLDTIGLTPDLVKTIVQADTGQARSALDELARRLRAMDGETATTYVRTVYQHIGRSTQAGGIDGDPTTPQAGGGFVPKTGLPYADRHHYLLADGEGVTTNRHGETDRFRDVISGINAGLSRHQIKGMLADGGFAGGGGRSLDDRLSIAQTIQEIRQLRRDLARDGKNKLDGIDRRIAELQLDAARREIQFIKTREEREARQEARQEAREQRQARSELQGSMAGMFDGIIPTDPQTVAQQVASTIADFREQWLAAGGEWTREMREWAQQTRQAARAYDAAQTALEAEQAKREVLVQQLAEQQAQLDQLNSTMEAYASTVANRFLSNPFGSVTVDGVPGQATAAFQAAQEQLKAMQAAGGGVASAAQISRLMQQIALLQEQADAETAPRELTGLDALRSNLTKDTQNALDLAAGLQTLADKGLDTSGDLGGLYEKLAAEGDLATIQELAALSAEQIDEYEKMFKAREDAAALVAAQATQAVYGEQQAALMTQVAQSTAAIQAVDASMVLLEAAIAVLGEQVRLGAEAGAQVTATKLEPGITAIKTSVDALPRELKQLLRQGGK